MAFAVQAGQLELNVMMPLMAQLALESTHIMKNALHSIRVRCIDGIKANEAQCEKYLVMTSQISTALNPIIGYAKAAELTKEALSENKSVIQLVKEKKLLTNEQIDTLLNFREMTIPK
jgi:aspartate ammonia-lyase